MNRSARQLRKFAIFGSDGTIGRTEELLVDPETWTVRYLQARLAGPVPERRVLVSPMSLSEVDWRGRRLRTRHSRRQVEEGPHLALHRGVSRAQELRYLRHFRLPCYWGGVGLWGDQMSPRLLVQACAAVGNGGSHTREAGTRLLGAGRLLRSRLLASDGEVGAVSDLILDEASWAIRFLVIETGPWLPGRLVMANPAWIEEVDRRRLLLVVGLPRAAVRSATEVMEVEQWRL